MTYRIGDNWQDCCRSYEKTLMRELDEVMERNDSFAEEEETEDDKPR